jgi:hypothetical protein
MSSDQRWHRLEPTRLTVKQRQPWLVPSPGTVAQVLPARRTDPWPAVVREVKLGEYLKPYPFSLVLIESPPSKFLPQLDLRTSLATDTNVEAFQLLGARSI